MLRAPAAQLALAFGAGAVAAVSVHALLGYSWPSSDPAKASCCSGVSATEKEAPAARLEAAGGASEEPAAPLVPGARTKRIPVQRLKDFTAATFVYCGVPEEDAARAADALLRVDSA